MIRLAGICLVAVACFAQTGARDPVIRINVDLVQIDAVVADSQGNAVTDLTADDFEIRQDGARQTITNFSYITPPSRERAPQLVSRAGDVKGAAPPLPPAKLSPGDVRRTMAIVVDDLGLTAGGAHRTRQAIREFIDNEMEPDDLVAVVRTGAGIGVLQQFTSDKRLLYSALARVKFNPASRIGVSGSGLDSVLDRMSFEASLRLTAEALKYVLNGLREFAGRKSVMLFSESMPGDYRWLWSDLANRSSAVIYGVDPGGLRTNGFRLEDQLMSAQWQTVPDWLDERFRISSSSQGGTLQLAQATGGLFYRGTNDITGALHKAVADSGAYYLIGYHPPSGTFGEKTGDLYRRLSVRVKRRGLKLRTRAGFRGTPERDGPPVPRTGSAQLVHAAVAPFTSGELGVHLTPVFSSGPNGPFVTVLLHIDARQLSFSDQADGRHQAVFDVLAMTFGDNGQLAASGGRTFTISVKGKTYEGVLKNGLLCALQHAIKKPDAYQLRVAVRDTASGRVGSANQYVEVPDLKNGRLMLSGILMSQDESDAPMAIGEPAPAGHPLRNPAVREFAPGQPVSYSYRVFNLNAPDPTVQVRLFRDAAKVYESQPEVLPAGTRKKGEPLMAAGRLNLGPEMKPGDYVLQIVVTDPQAKEKYRTATQWLDFELR